MKPGPCAIVVVVFSLKHMSPIQQGSFQHIGYEEPSHNMRAELASRACVFGTLKQSVLAAISFLTLPYC